MPRFLHLDVFTDRPLAGNQLAVFTEPGSGFDTATRVAIAREMAFSETVFVEAPESPGAIVRLRIFTPATELPMAGHPTIGSAFALAHEGVIARGTASAIFDLGIGPTPIGLEWDEKGLAFAWMTQQLPSFGAEVTALDSLAAALGIDAAALAATKLPPQVVSCGLPFLIVPLATRADVDRCTVSADRVSRFFASISGPEIGILVCSTEAANDDAQVYSRMFAPALGVAEDPATGSASGPLGCYLSHHWVVSPETARRIVSLQGVRMGRPSRIHVSVATDGDAITDVRVGGTAVLVAEGTLTCYS